MRYRFLTPRMETTGVPGDLHLAPQVPACQLLDRMSCRAMADLVMQAHEAGKGWPSRTRYASETQWGVDGGFRRSTNLPPSLEGLSPAYDAMHSQALAALPSFGLTPGVHELMPVDAQCLVYREGDHVGDHADDSALEAGEDGGLAWRVVKPERHLAGVLWLTQHSGDGTGRHEFSGGALRFNSLVHQSTGEPLDIEPQAGMMVLFPANPWFRHQVLPVRGGTRIALTRWWKVVPAGPSP